MIHVQIDQLLLSNVGFVVMLRKPGEERVLPIFIGAAEAQAIALHVNKVQVPRPLTHDLLKNVLDFLECRLKHIEVCELREGTFYAKLVLDRDGTVMEVDSRPSDAIALALRCGAPIYVDEKVMEEAGRVMTDTEPGKSAPAKTPSPPHREAAPAELLKKKLADLIHQEKYEEAAKVRDEIRRLEEKHARN